MESTEPYPKEKEEKEKKNGTIHMIAKFLVAVEGKIISGNY